MRLKVYLLRYRGRRLAWRDVSNGPRYIGEVLLKHVVLGDERYSVMTLTVDDPAAPSPIPPLYQPVLLGFSTLAFRLRGFERWERGSGTFDVIQEWHCELP